MGLYLCVFADSKSDDELDGVEVGSYDDFHIFRSAVAAHLENGQWASRFPVLMLHPDSDGEWSPKEAANLAGELATIETEFSKLPPKPFPREGWQEEVAKSVGLTPASLADCFIDVDGEPLLSRLRGLAELAANHYCPISFQLSLCPGRCAWTGHAAKGPSNPSSAPPEYGICLRRSPFEGGREQPAGDGITRSFLNDPSTATSLVDVGVRKYNPATTRSTYNWVARTHREHEPSELQCKP